jgi:hypothetical protein
MVSMMVEQRGGGGGCSSTASIAFTLISPVTFHIKRKVRINHVFDDSEILISHTYFSIKFFSPLIPKLPNVNQSAPAKIQQSTTKNEKVHDNKPKWIREFWNNSPPLWGFMTNITNLQ